MSSSVPTAGSGAAGPGASDAITEEDGAVLAETLETLTLIGKVPEPGIAATEAAASSTMESAETSSSSGSASLAKKDVEELVFGRGKKKVAPVAAGANVEHRFWDTQPVPKVDASPATVNGPIDGLKTVADVRQEPYSLPAGFEWSTIDVTSDAQKVELYELLRDNYVEDDDNMFRFNYSVDFLQWALTPPHYCPEWHVGVRATKGGKLVASITGVPATMRVHGAAVPLCEINFLCVHKRLRTKRLAPVLIKEVTRRVNLRGVWQATYTAGVVLPKPVASCQYWHRSLNPKKLIEVGFSRLAPRMTMARTMRLHALPAAPATPGLRAATAADVPAITRLLDAFLRKFAFAPALDEGEVAHWLLPRPGVVDSFVVDTATAAAAVAAADALISDGSSSGKGGKAPAPPAVHPVSGSTVTDFLSFYHLPSTIIGHDRHKALNAVYCYYIAPGAAIPLPASAATGAGAVASASASSGSGGALAADAAVPLCSVGHSVQQLLEDALVLAKERDVDVFNALDLMENAPALLKELKFGPGDGHLQYYLYNWACPGVEPKDVGLVLL